MYRSTWDNTTLAVVINSGHCMYIYAVTPRGVVVRCNESQHDITWRYTRLHVITLHWVTLFYTPPYIYQFYFVLQQHILHHAAMHCDELDNVVRPHSSLNWFTTHYIALRYVILNGITCHYTTLHYVMVRYMALRWAMRYIPSGYSHDKWLHLVTRPQGEWPHITTNNNAWQYTESDQTA